MQHSGRACLTLTLVYSGLDGSFQIADAGNWVTKARLFTMVTSTTTGIRPEPRRFNALGVLQRAL